MTTATEKPETKNLTPIEKAQQRVKDLEEKLKQAKALKQKAEARVKAAESKQNRAADTRRKILVGAAILAKVERGEWPKDKMLEMMGQQLTRTDDRALFDLPVNEKVAS
ncbi:putative 2-oxoglutarate/Fe(II)-dependent dioxygenase YbiX [Janthinobacterium sp. CG_23.3]|jgi:predicted 2-oxoglutarate/Fe(II)-dependent dioxygenase YbiX|uniref:mobilization protein n=1 Tax=unclassified Janthinobacterium TaxID=2610881 RepID=UPI0018DED4A4|nr:mobilization protein [Janthinobacterium sp. CG3]